jgi:hypothetical protein
MDRILLVVAIALLYSSSSYAVDGDRAPDGFQYSLVSYHEDVSGWAKPTAWKGKYGRLANESMTIEEIPLDDSVDRKVSVPGTSIGLGVAPFYGNYGVFRTSSSSDNSTYIAVGFILDELTVDEDGTSNSWDDSGFSYGFGINNSSYNIEYMLSVDEENFDLSAISLGFTTEF